MNISTKFISYLCMAYITYQAGISIIAVDKSWESKIRSQRENFYQVSTSRDKWRELSEFRELWPKMFAEESFASVSRHELYKELRLAQGLIPTVSRISQSETNSILQNGETIGLSQTCVKNEPNGFTIGSENLASLFSGLRQLESRREISFKGLALTNNSGKPRVIIRDLCIFFRTGGI